MGVLLDLAGVSIAQGSDEGARDAVLEAFTFSRETGSRRLGMRAIETAASLSALNGRDWALTVRLHAAAARQRTEMGYYDDTLGSAALAASIVKARDALGASAVDSGTAAGPMLSYEEALAQARASIGR